MKIWQQITLLVAVIVILAFGGTVAIVVAISNPPVAVSSPCSEEMAGVDAQSAPVRLDGTAMSVSEFQAWLKKRGYYKGKIDGKVSNDYINSQTQIAWDAMYNDQCGVEDMRAAVSY